MLSQSRRLQNREAETTFPPQLFKAVSTLMVLDAFSTTISEPDCEQHNVHPAHLCFLLTGAVQPVQVLL